MSRLLKNKEFSVIQQSVSHKTTHIPKSLSICYRTKYHDITAYITCTCCLSFIETSSGKYQNSLFKLIN
ncbi:hypothetical protein EPHNCH_1491 [Anaplasma phagocytophilum str. NCH-1]|uniref:Uncharacterized protein n=1 Tax=Anaplasma phagocytophilum str. NCH-1 TaxID=1359161 RepID=A0A0F3MVH3_ANAPH|nr:hypothetical protein EPHNCH_1491 [Anaplasma phagocytophilum str. NCH-1]